VINRCIVKWQHRGAGACGLEGWPHRSAEHPSPSSNYHDSLPEFGGSCPGESRVSYLLKEVTLPILD